MHITSKKKSDRSSTGSQAARTLFLFLASGFEDGFFSEQLSCEAVARSGLNIQSSQSHCEGENIVGSTDGKCISDIPIHMLARAVSEGGSRSPPAAMSTLDQSEVLAKLTAQYERMSDAYAIADTTVSLQRVACQLGYDDMDAVIIEDMALEALKEIEKLRVKKMMEAAARPF